MAEAGRAASEATAKAAAAKNFFIEFSHRRPWPQTRFIAEMRDAVTPANHHDCVLLQCVFPAFTKGFRRFAADQQIACSHFVLSVLVEAMEHPVVAPC
jgi:hypothetical protein